MVNADLYDFERIVTEMLERTKKIKAYTDFEEAIKQGKISAFENLLDRLDESKR